jgi:hypothetical protein
MIRHNEESAPGVSVKLATLIDAENEEHVLAGAKCLV